MLFRHTTAGLAMLASLILGAGCAGNKAEPAEGDNQADVAGSTNSTEVAQETESSTDLPSDDELRGFVEDLTSGETASTEAASRLTARGSLANAYATYIAASTLAVVSGGDSGGLEAATVTSVDDGFEACAPSAPDSCHEFTDFEGDDGLIVDFVVDGQPLRGTVIVGDGKALNAGDLGTIELVAARVNDEGNLFIALDVRSADRPIQVGWGSSAYRNEDGRQVDADGSVYGPLELGPNSLGSVLVMYPGADLGGDLTFPLFTDDFMSESPVTIPLR